jgi:hypothetical protein
VWRESRDEYVIGPDGRVYWHDVEDPMQRVNMKSLLLAFMLVAVPDIVRAQSTSCRTSDSTATGVVRYTKVLVATNSPDRVPVRTAAGLEASDSSKVVLVTDSRICDKAVTGINTFKQTTGLPRHVYLVKAGSYYLAFDPDEPTGHHRPIFVLNRQYVARGEIAAF